jgi:DNA-binding CsgD family transcriptional regulator
VTLSSLIFGAVATEPWPPYSVQDGGADLMQALMIASRLLSTGEHALADAVLTRAIGLAERDEERVAAAVTQATNCFNNLADSEGALNRLDRAALLVLDARCRDELDRHRATIFLMVGRTRESADLARAVLERGLLWPEAMSDTADLVMVADWLLARPLHEGVGGLPGGGRLNFAIDVTSPLTPAGDEDEGRHEPAEPDLATVYRFARALRSELAGDIDGATAELDRALVVLPESDPMRVQAMIRAQQAYLAVLRGDLTAADRALVAARAMSSPVVRLGEFPFGRADAWLTAARGDRPEAQRRLAATARECERMGHVTLALAAWLDVARLGDADAALAGARQIVARTGAQLAVGTEAFLQLWHHGPRAQLAQVVEWLDACGFALLAAEAAAQVSRQAADNGEGRDAERWASVAAGLADRHGGWWSPAFEGARHVTLTAREREIAGLIELGFSNREIGRRLRISVRTVENHAQSVYVKLGVHSRDDLRMAWSC